MTIQGLVSQYGVVGWCSQNIRDNYHPTYTSIDISAMVAFLMNETWSLDLQLMFPPQGTGINYRGDLHWISPIASMKMICL